MKENQPQSEFKGINTGLKQLNTVTGGWQKGDLVLLASRPKMGKTRMMIFFAKTAAVEGLPVCVYSIESNKEAITKLLMLSFSNLSDSSELPIRFHKDESDKSLEGYGEIIIAKNLHGPIQNVPYKYNKSMTKLSDY